MPPKAGFKQFSKPFISTKKKPVFCFLFHLLFPFSHLLSPFFFLCHFQAFLPLFFITSPAHFSHEKAHIRKGCSHGYPPKEPFSPNYHPKFSEKAIIPLIMAEVNGSSSSQKGNQIRGQNQKQGQKQSSRKSLSGLVNFSCQSTEIKNSPENQELGFRA